MSKQGLEKLTKTYRSMFDKVKGKPKKYKCDKLGLCSYYIDSKTAPIRFALRQAMWKAATTTNPKQPICKNVWTHYWQKKLLRNIVRGECDKYGPYHYNWKGCMGAIKNLSNIRTCKGYKDW